MLDPSSRRYVIVKKLFILSLVFPVAVFAAGPLEHETLAGGCMTQSSAPHVSGESFHAEVVNQNGTTVRTYNGKKVALISSPGNGIVAAIMETGLECPAGTSPIAPPAIPHFGARPYATAVAKHICECYYNSTKNWCNCRDKNIGPVVDWANSTSKPPVSCLPD